MGHLQLSQTDALYYEHHTPADHQKSTFVFFNALTGDTATWEAVIGPLLRNAGYGTLAFNMRGQSDSPFSSGLELSEEVIVKDTVRLLSEVQPSAAILVGLSIGGLFACRSWLKGVDAIGLVLINTLRRDGPRLKWIADALVRAVEVGGLNLFRDLYLPLLMNENWLKKNRSNFLLPNPTYFSLKPDSGHFKLLSEAGRGSDWNIPYEKLKLPTLVITGLQDHVFLDLEVVDELFSRLPLGRRIDMTDAGHLIPSEQPEVLAKHLISFAQELD